MNSLQIVLFVVFCKILAVTCDGLREEFTWTRISYEWPKPKTTRGARYQSGGVTSSEEVIMFPEDDPVGPPPDIPYIYENNIPMGANKWHNKLFVTVPRRRMGVPSSLNFVWTNSSRSRHNVPLIPYPDWESNLLNGSADTRFVSVYRVAIDACDRLWFVDTGLIETLGNQTHVQPHALVVMDLKTDTVIRRHVFNPSLLRPNTALASLTVDVTDGRCEDAFAYMPDLSGFGLVVYGWRDDDAWRVTHNYFYLEPTAGEFSIGGHQFQWNDGVFSIALSHKKPDGYRDAYFHSMAGLNQYRVSTRILRNETLAARSYHGGDFENLGSRGPLSQTSSCALHEPTGILFLDFVNQNALACWNINTPLSHISVVQKDNLRMIYPSDVKISGDEVVLLTNTMPVFLYGTLNYNMTNFRVWMERVDRAVRGTKCASRRGGLH